MSFCPSFLVNLSYEEEAGLNLAWTVSLPENEIPVSCCWKRRHRLANNEMKQKCNLLRFNKMYMSSPGPEQFQSGF